MINRSWHVGILFKAESSLYNYLPLEPVIEGVKYLETGWGDEDFYQNPDEFDLYLGAKAILVPTSSVIRVQYFSSDPEWIFSGAEFCIKFELSEENYRRLCLRITDSFMKDDEGNPSKIKTEQVGSVCFYKSKENYCLFNTCNTWVSEVLNSAGISTEGETIITSEQLYFALKDKGSVIVEYRK